MIGWRSRRSDAQRTMSTGPMSGHHDAPLYDRAVALRNYVGTADQPPG